MTKDLTGQRFGRLVVLDRIPPGKLPLGNMERTATQPTAEQGGGAMKKFVAITPEVELGRIVHLAQLKDKLRAKWEGRGMACAQREEVSDKQGAAGSG